MASEFLPIGSPMRFSKGELIERSVRENGTGEPDAPEGYGIAALTTLGNRSGES